MKRIFPLLFAFLLLAQSSFALTLGDIDGGASCDPATDYFAVTYTSTATWDVSAVSANASELGTNGYTFGGGVWADNGSNRAGALLATGATGNALPDSGGDTCASNSYVTSTISPAVEITAQQLWFGGREDTGGALNNMELTYDSGADGVERGGVGGVTDPFGTATFRDNRQYSAYITYTVTSGAARRMFVVQ